MKPRFSGIEVIRDGQFGFLKETLVAAVSGMKMMAGRTLGSENKPFWAVFGITLFFLAFVPYMFFFNELFKFAPLDASQLGICALAAVISMSVFELAKPFQKIRANDASFSLKLQGCRLFLRSELENLD